MSDNLKWFCLVISSVSHYGRADVIVDDIKGVLFPSPCKFVVIKDINGNEKSDEYFIFVSCPSFLKKYEEVLGLSGILRVISSGDRPYVFSGEDLEKFSDSITKKDNAPLFKKGDVVSVKSGYLKNLFGLVLNKTKENKLRVLFRFHVRDFITEMEVKDLKYEKNVFDIMPVNTDKKTWFKKFME